MMEDETGFLSRDDEKEELKLERITKLLSNILTDLNEKKVTTIIGMSSVRFKFSIKNNCCNFRGRNHNLPENTES